jgi:hypothetical protein
MTEQLPSTEIVSEVLRTAAGDDAWVERDGVGRLYVRCGGGLYQRSPAMAPALASLVDHVASCTCRGGGKAVSADNHA